MAKQTAYTVVFHGSSVPVKTIYVYKDRCRIRRRIITVAITHHCLTITTWGAQPAPTATIAHLTPRLRRATPPSAGLPGPFTFTSTAVAEPPTFHLLSFRILLILSILLSVFYFLPPFHLSPAP